MTTWTSKLNADPLPWLFEVRDPAVKHVALRRLLDRRADDPAVVRSLAKAMDSDPIAAILAALHPEGYWQKPGPGYSTKYRGTVWQVMFLDQLGADAADDRVRRACEYVLSHTQSEAGGFGASGEIESPPPPSRVIHCLNGNLLRALIGFGFLHDDRVQRAVDWEARAITGEDCRYYESATNGPGFRCAANDKKPCAWGAVKAMLALARVPTADRTPRVKRAIEQGIDFLLSCDPATARYPFPSRDSKPSGSWLKLGFPSGYVCDILQILEALCELGLAQDARLATAVDWLLAKQNRQGRWNNEYAYNGKTWVDFEPQGEPSKWVTLRACRVLRAILANPEEHGVAGRASMPDMPSKGWPTPSSALRSWRRSNLPWRRAT